MGNEINMLGQKCGRLVVLESAGKTRYGAALWRCQCECGIMKTVRGTSLRNGEIRSCGCLHPRLDLTGQKYGKLTVLRIHHKRGKRGQILWGCLCECGDMTIAATGNLRSGNSKSCGCARRYTGEKSTRWNASISAEDRERARNEKKAKAWREAVYLHDDYVCTKCGQRGGDVNAHHVVPYAKNKELKYEPVNGATLCVKCHRAFHSLHGINYSKPAFSNWLAVIPAGTIA